MVGTLDNKEKQPTFINIQLQFILHNHNANEQYILYFKSAGMAGKYCKTNCYACECLK